MTKLNIAGYPPDGEVMEDGAGEAAISKAKPGGWFFGAIAGAGSGFDWCCAAAIMVCGMWLFGAGYRSLGFYADDAAFMTDFKGMSVSHTLWEATNYVPGRNLHIIWQYLIYAFTGGPSLRALPAQHGLQALLTSSNATLLFFLLRRLSLPTMPSVAAAWLFLLGPTHGEVHFWLSALPMNLVSTFFVLCLALSSLATARAALRGEEARVKRLMLVDGSIFIAGVFTYDQAAPILAALSILTALAVLWARRELARRALMLAGLVCAVLAVLVVWKAHAPGGGPGFSSAHMEHISKEFQESLDLIWGRAFRVILFEQTLPFSTPTIRAEAACFSGAILCLGLVCVWWDGRAGASASNPSLKRLFVLLLGAVAFFLLAYVPVYLWFISPRHTYLPSIGVACAAGIVVAAPVSVLQRYFGRACAGLLGLELVCILSGVTYDLAQSILVDKESWIVSYQARKHLYEDLSHDEKFLTASLFVFESVPLKSPFGSGILGYENASEPFLMTRGVSKVNYLRPFSLPSPTGDFIFVELEEWGKDQFLHIPKEKVFRIRYESLNRKRMRFRLTEPVPAPPQITVEPLEAVEGAAGESWANTKARLIRTGADTLELSVPPTHLRPGNVLAAVPLVGDHPGAEPLTSEMPDTRRYMQIVELPVIGKQHAARFRLQFDPKFPGVKGVSLYVVGDVMRHPLGEVFLAP